MAYVRERGSALRRATAQFAAERIRNDGLPAALMWIACIVGDEDTEEELERSFHEAPEVRPREDQMP